jgi:hypothetical protein
MTNQEKEIARLNGKLERIRFILDEGIPDCPMNSSEQDEK